MTKDPVCGMEVDEEKAAAKSEHRGKTYYFCAPGCKKAFDANPGKYTGGEHKMHGHGGHKCNQDPLSGSYGEGDSLAAPSTILDFTMEMQTSPLAIALEGHGFLMTPLPEATVYTLGSINPFPYLSPFLYLS